MSTLTLHDANQTLAAAGIALRMTQKGLATVSKTSLFAKALAYCTKNRDARDDVISILAHYKNQSDLVFEVSQQHQTMLDAAPNGNRLDNPPAKPQRAAANTRPKPSQPQESPPMTVQNTPKNTQSADNARQSFVGHHVYGNKSALYFAFDETRNGDATIAIDGAMAVGTRQYDWSKKLRIQITRGDLPTVSAVVFGLLNKADLSNYGADNTKRLSIENQGKNFFLNMSAKDYNQIAVPISASDVFELRGLFLAQLLKNRPEIGVEGVLANLKCHAAMLKVNHQSN